MTPPKLVSDAMALPPDQREELAAMSLDSLEPPAGISIDDVDEIDRRAEAVRSGEVSSVADPTDPGMGFQKGKLALAGNPDAMIAWSVLEPFCNLILEPISCESMSRAF